MRDKSQHLRTDFNVLIRGFKNRWDAAIVWAGKLFVLGADSNNTAHIVQN